MKCGPGLGAVAGSQEALQSSWTWRRQPHQDWGSETCTSSLRILRWAKYVHICLQILIILCVSLRTEVNHYCNNCIVVRQYWRNLFVVPNKPPPPTSVQIKLNLAHPTWSQYCPYKLWQWNKLNREIGIPFIADPNLLTGLGRLVRLVKLLRLLWRWGPTQVRDLFI